RGLSAHRAGIADRAGAGVVTGRGFSSGRVWAMLLRYLYLLRSSWPRTLELTYWPTLQMPIWGFMSQFLYLNSSYVFRFFAVLLVMGWALGMAICGLILRQGMGAEGLAWTVVFTISPISAVYYPVSILPGWLQHVSWVLPSTYVFEGMRAVLFSETFRID